jgi:Protein of unknown function, DUF481
MMRKLFILLFLNVLLYSNTYSQVNTESFRIKSDSIGFSLLSDIELTLMAGNTDFQYFGSNSRINYAWTSDNSTFLILNGGFGRKNGNTFFSQALFHLRHVRAITDNLKLELFTQYDNNKSLLLTDRYIAGGGVRSQILNFDRLTSHTGLSVFAEREVYDLPENALHAQKTHGFRFNSYLTFNLKLKEDMIFLSVTYLQPDIKKLDDLRVLSNNALNIKVSKSLSINIKTDVRYDSRPADGIKKYDFVSKIGLAISI